MAGLEAGEGGVVAAAMIYLLAISIMTLITSSADILCTLVDLRARFVTQVVW